MAEPVGSVSVKVLPDLSEWERILDAIPTTGLTATEYVTFEYNEDGQVSRQTTVRTVTKAV